jgi:hypothetical protein
MNFKIKIREVVFKFTKEKSMQVCIYMVASKCSQNQFISEKYKTLQSFKLYFHQNSPLVQL